ncbi:stage II sporulation protein P [Aquibacillus rhizosphaerae]|uniref:Stage II sporulation protein P n=1 Tax=Aquibacillus rhizosphaerae TaxID=3051431 RepID=A0ABT7L6I2_9BACI|nr:stage II sporulation protein P [Aquibacillus sp. LR5S19]MDL4841484.1 stage II sporulation protein P [Aquibacillus sp. LR5S19]
MNKPNINSVREIIIRSKPWKKLTILIASVLALFIFIGLLTTIQPAYRLYSSTISEWTSQIQGSSFLYLLRMENKSFDQAFPEDKESIDLSYLVFEMATSVKPNDARSLLGRELPGFEAYDRQILIAGEGTDYTNLTAESTPPLEVVLEDREADMPDDDTDGTTEEEDVPNDSAEQSTGEREVVFIYSTHNRESFLPHLPKTDEPDNAFHPEVNITKVSEQLAKELKNQGIGSEVDTTDFMTILLENDWNYTTHSYQASKPIVETALANNKDLNFVFDLHRDSTRRDVTTKSINGEDYAKLMFVIGGDNANYERNLKLASELHERLEQRYPGLSRGVEKYGGAGRNGVYNQDVSNNALTIEFGGVDNNMDELYRSAEALAKVFSDYYWDAEKVQGNP